MYCSSSDVWNYLGKDAYTKVRSEAVGTGDGTASNFSLDHDNVITSSLTVYTGSVAATSSFTIDYDDGEIFGLTASSGSAITADYDYADLPDSVIEDMIENSDAEIDLTTGRTFTSVTGSVEYLSVESGQNVFFLKNYPILSLTTVDKNISSQTNAPQWYRLAGGLGEDYIANSEDLAIGRIRIIDNGPDAGDDVLKITYNYGYSTIPALARELSLLLTIRQIANLYH